MARYKEQMLNKVAQLDNMMRTLDFMVSRGESQDMIKEYITETKEKIDELRSLISLEHDDFQTYV